MFNYFKFVIVIMPLSLFAAQIDVDELLHEGRLPIILNVIHNKRNEQMTELHKQNLELSSQGKFRTREVESLKRNIQLKDCIQLRLSEYKDYYLKVPGDNSKFLRLQFDLVIGDKGPGFLKLILTRVMLQPKRNYVDEKRLVSRDIDLRKLETESKKQLESIQLNIVVDGAKMENSSVEAVPVFKEDSGSPATPARPAVCTLSQATRRS